MNNKAETDDSIVIKLDEDLIISPYPNGGWVINQRADEPGRMAKCVGAYSNSDDMISALSKALGKTG